MLPFLRSRRSLYSWALAGLTDVAVATPLLLFCYSALGLNDLPDVVPGAWLLMLIFSLASAWEAGNRGEQAQSPVRRSLAMAVGMSLGYVAAYLVLPARLQTGLLSANDAWAVVPVAGFLWYQGTTAVADGVTYSRLFSRFGWQVVIVVAGILLLTATGGARDPRIAVMLWWSVVLLFGAGLVSLIVARETLLRQGQASTGDHEEAGRSQSPAVSLIIVAFMLLTIAASTIMGADRLVGIASTIGNGISAVWSWLVDVLMLIVWRWSQLIWLVLEPIIKWMLANQKPPPPQEGDGEDLAFSDPIEDPRITGESVEAILRVVLIAAAAIAAVVLIYRLNSRVRKRDHADEEETESLGFWQNLLGDLKGLLQRDGAPAPAAVALPDVLAAGDLRHLLRRLQTWGAFRAGRPREQSETPNAYGEALAERRPERQAEVASVTAVYNQVRYGGAPPSAERVQQATAAMAELEQEPSGP